MPAQWRRSGGIATLTSHLSFSCCRLVTWLPNEMWVYILSQIRRSNIGPNDALAGIQLATGGGKLKIGHVPSGGGGKMRSVSGRSGASEDTGDIASPEPEVDQDGSDGSDADESDPGSRATSGLASAEATAAGRPVKNADGSADLTTATDPPTASDPSDGVGPRAGSAGSGPRKSNLKDLTPASSGAGAGGDRSGPVASMSGAADMEDDWGGGKRSKGKGKGKKAKKANKRWDDEEDEAAAASAASAASGSAASEPAPAKGKSKASKSKKNKKGRRWDEEEDAADAAEAAKAAKAAGEGEGAADDHGDDAAMDRRGDDVDLGAGLLEEKALSKTAKKAKRREQRAARAQAFCSGDSILDGDGDLDANLDAMIMGGGKKGKKKKNTGVRQNYDHEPGGGEDSGGATIPCDVCGKQLPLMLFVAHSEECNARIRREAAADQAYRGPADA